MMFQSREKANQKYSEIIVRKLEATALDAVIFYYGKIHVSADDYWVEFCYCDINFDDYTFLIRRNRNDYAYRN